METKARRTLVARNEEPKTLSDKIGEFIRKFRSVILSVIVAIIIVIAIILIWSGISSSRTNAAAAAFEAAEKSFSTWSSEQDQVKKDALVAGLEKDLTTLTLKWPKTFVAQQGFSMQARLLESKKDFEGAEKLWLKAYESNSKSYFASVAMQSAASAAENRGDSAKALEYYQKIIAGAKNGMIGVAHAYFSAGRLQESLNDYAAAKKSYEDLVAAYPDGDWATLAKNRLIHIDAAKLIK